MKQEHKELLLKDLCSRLPYGVNVEYDNCVCEVLSIDKYNEELTIWKSPGCYSLVVKLEDCKPYLFPFESMTEEQKKELEELCAEDFMSGICYFSSDSIDWLNKNYFDYRDRRLIPLGLAIDATGLNIY